MSKQSFASDLRKFAERANKSLDDTCRAVAIKWFSSTVMGTPVDTGRLRGNWQMTLALQRKVLPIYSTRPEQLLLQPLLKRLAVSEKSIILSTTCHMLKSRNMADGTH